MNSIVVFLALVVCANAAREVTIDGAFRYDDDIILIAGDEIMAIGSDGREKYVKSRAEATEFLPPAGIPINSAIRWPLKSLVYYYGDYHSHKMDLDAGTERVAPYGPTRQFIARGGPDAASFVNGKFYTFKGCSYVMTQGTLAYLNRGTTYPTRALGLPCDIGAAWTSQDRKSMTLLKGTMLFITDGASRRPTVRSFNDVFSITSWTIRRTPDQIA